MKKKLAILMLGVLVLGGLAGFYVWKFVYNKPHPDYIALPPDFVLEAGVLFDQFATNSAVSEVRYNGKVVELHGAVSSIETADSMMVVVFAFRQGDFGDEGIRCSFDSRAKEAAHALVPGGEVRIKGYLTGYNGTDVILEKCSLVQ